MKNLVTVKNNQVVVSSRQVADKFGKEHRHVLENIRQILGAENSAAKFFHEDYVEYRGQKFPVYLMNRDGFTLLAMGFTGKDALQWKLKYIAAFNEMEAQLNGKPVSLLKEKEIEAKLNNSRARLNNSRARMAALILKCADNTKSETYKEICNKNAVDILAGREVVPMLEGQKETLSAVELGEKLGISGAMVGRIANKYNLKTEQYGQWFHTTCKNNAKREVDTFRYYECAIAKFREILKGGAAA